MVIIPYGQFRNTLLKKFLTAIDTFCHLSKIRHLMNKKKPSNNYAHLLTGTICTIFITEAEVQNEKVNK